jgi:hypothetical protein
LSLTGTDVRGPSAIALGLVLLGCACLVIVYRRSLSG